MKQSSEWLTNEEVDQVIRARLEGEKLTGGGCTDAELLEAVNWAEGIRINQALLSNVLKGNAVMSKNEDGEFGFDLTERGRRAVWRVR